MRDIESGFSITLKDTPENQLFAKRFEQIKICSEAEMAYTVNCSIFNLEKPYRRYRRGKGRCTRCGLKGHVNNL